jgi:hypothetical protein
MLDSRRTGVTRAELLVVAAICITLLGLLLPSIQAVREAAARIQCANNLHTVTIAAHNTNSAYAFVPSNPDIVNDRFGTTQDHLQPFLE